LFGSSEYLADVLTQCAFIEDNFYQQDNSRRKADLGNTIIKVYKAILHYTAEVRTAQKPSKAKRIKDLVTTITNGPFTELQRFVDEKMKDLHQLIGIYQHLQHKKDAENILDKINTALALLQEMANDSIFSKLPRLDEASFDSYDQDEDKCLPGTRTELLQEITEWGLSPNSQCIFWLNGMAGTGKSTVSRTVAASFKEKGILGASFFFKRGAGDRANAKRFFPEITRQLMARIPRLRPGVKRAIEKDTGISAKSLREQFSRLLLQPLLDLEQLNQQKPFIVIVIDALDECERENDVQVILELLPQVKELTSIHLRFFLTSRPELPIVLGFKEVEHTDHQDLILHEIPKPVISRDISLFLNHRFSKIRKKHSLPQEWPGDGKIRRLVEIALPLFIFAATVCLFVEDLKWSPEERLEEFLKDPATTSASEMDRTYLPILKQLLTGRNTAESDKLKQEFNEIIGVIILLASPLSVKALIQLINKQEQKDNVIRRLESFRSILNVPSDPDKPVHILHLSFRDFLLNSDSRFQVNEQAAHLQIATHCLRIMCNRLKKNICHLASDGTQRMEITTETINQHLSADLQYSCRYWVYHLEQSKVPITNDILVFLETHFLHWLEAISVMGIVSEAVSIINTLLSVTQVSLISTRF
jgi:hypothetical protein